MEDIIYIEVYSCGRSWTVEPEKEELSVKTIGDRIYIKVGEKLQLDLPQEQTIVEYFYLGDEVVEKKKNYRDVMIEKVKQAKERIFKQNTKNED